MFTKIVLATDLSKSTDAVIRCLGGLRKLGTNQVVLVHALGINYMKDVAPILIELAEPRLAEQKAALEQQGFLTTVKIAPGVTMFEVNRIAQEEEASLMVVGSHGGTTAAEVLLGGTALAILHHATIPVLVIRLKIDEKQSIPTYEVVNKDLLKHVLYATDFSDTSEQAFLYVEKIVESGAQNITLLHVQEKSDLSKHLEHRLAEFNAIDRERLERMRDRLVKLGSTEVQIEIPYGSPLQEIIRYASQQDHSLVVMGSKGRGFLREVFMGSVSHGVAMHANIPLLMVPAKQ